MKHKLNILLMLLFAVSYSNAQTYYTKTATVIFKSKSVVENIEAHNKSVACILNLNSGSVQVALNIKSFVFDKKLMQEHFNENYMESGKYPKSTFIGKVDNLSKIQFSRDGKYQSTVSGKLNIHGVTKNVKIPVAFIIRDGAIKVQSIFQVALVDYKIDIPNVVRAKISKVIDIQLASKMIKK